MAPPATKAREASAQAGAELNASPRGSARNERSRTARERSTADHRGDDSQIELASLEINRACASPAVIGDASRASRPSLTSLQARRGIGRADLLTRPRSPGSRRHHHERRWQPDGAGGRGELRRRAPTLAARAVQDERCGDRQVRPARAPVVNAGSGPLPKLLICTPKAWAMETRR